MKMSENENKKNIVKVKGMLSRILFPRPANDLGKNESSSFGITVWEVIDIIEGKLKDEFNVIKKFFDEELKINKNLKIMKFIRNHIQHNGLLNPETMINGKNLSEELREQTLKFKMDKNKEDHK